MYHSPVLMLNIFIVSIDESLVKIIFVSIYSHFPASFIDLSIHLINKLKHLMHTSVYIHLVNVRS